LGPLDEIGETPSNCDGQQIANSKDTLFDWLVRKAEMDLGLAHAFAAGETERADQIKRLETTLVRQFSELQYHILENREAELNDLKSEIFAFAERVARIEATKAPSDAIREFVQNELGSLRAQLSGRQQELETRHSGIEKLSETLGAQIRALEEQVREKIDAIRAAQGELRHFKSEAQSITERVGHAESSTWRTQTLAERNAQQIEQTASSFKREIAAIKSALSEQERNARTSDVLLKEIKQSLDARFEGIQARMAQEEESCRERDAQLGQLDCGLAALGERLAQTESLSLKAEESLQREAQCSLDFRMKLGEELAALEAKLCDTPSRDSDLRDLQESLGTRIEELRQYVAEKFLLLECREAEQEKRTKELETAFDIKLAAQEEHIQATFRAVASGEEELARLTPELQTLALRITQAESASRSAQNQVDAGSKRIVELAGNLQNEIATVRAELREQLGNFRLPEEQIREFEDKLDAKVAELERQLATEREGFLHWEKGLRRTLSSELAGMQARLSERQSQLEHRCTRYDRLEETVKEHLHGFEKELDAKLRAHDFGSEGKQQLQSEMLSLTERTSHLESLAEGAQAMLALGKEQSQQSFAALKSEIDVLRAHMEDRAAVPADSIIRGLEETVSAKIQLLQHQLEEKLSAIESRDAERAQHAEQFTKVLKDELHNLKTALDQQQNDRRVGGHRSDSIEESLRTEIREIEHKFDKRLSLIDDRDGERAQQAQKTAEELRTALAALQEGITDRPAALDQSVIRAFEESLGVRIRDLRQHVEEKINLLDQRDAERVRQAEEIVARFTTEMAAFKADATHPPRVIESSDPGLRGLEEVLGAKIHELRQQVAEKFSIFESRDAELKELKDATHSLKLRVAQLSAASPATQTTGPVSAQPTPPRPEISTVQMPDASPGAEPSPVKTHAPREKEQLVKLQERMSSEIERVRAELKERSGRWKVRKSVS
jgi:DNA repair exonuclease SbcCD ATPase subunit